MVRLVDSTSTEDDSIEHRLQALFDVWIDEEYNMPYGAWGQGTVELPYELTDGMSRLFSLGCYRSFHGKIDIANLRLSLLNGWTDIDIFFQIADAISVVVVGR